MIANRWYCIAQTTTFDSKCGISVNFEGGSIIFTASVRFGSSSLNIASCEIAEDYYVSVRLRETDSKWCVDLLSQTDINPTIDVTDTDSWISDSTPAGAGTILAVILDIDKSFNTTGGAGGSLFERINIGTEEGPKWAVVPKKIDNKFVGIVSDTFISAGGRNASAKTGLIEAVYGFDDLGGEFDRYNLTDTFNAFAINSIHMSLLSLSDVVQGIINGGGGTPGGGGGGGDTPGGGGTGSDEWKEMFEWYTDEDGVKSIRAKAGFFSDLFITAGGINGSSAGDVFERLDEWPAEWSSEYDGTVLSGLLAYELKQSIENLNTGGGLDEGQLKLYLDLHNYLTKGDADALYAPLNAILWEKVNIGTEDNPKWAVRPKNIDNTYVGILSDTFITAGGVNDDTSGVSLNRLDSWEDYDENAGDVLSAKLGYELKKSIENFQPGSGGINKEELDEYLATKNYLTRGVADTLYLSLDSFNMHLTSYAEDKEAVNARLEALESLWGVDDENKALYPKDDRGIYSYSFITAGGKASSGTSGGLIKTVYKFTDLGGTFNDNDTSSTFNAYTIDKMYSDFDDRLKSLESGSTGSFDESAMWVALGSNSTDKTISIDYIPYFDDYLPLYGGTMTGAIITPGNDSVVIMPAKDNFDQIGAEDCKFWKMHATLFKGDLEGNADTATNVKWSGVTDKPTTFGGYGITGGTLEGTLKIAPAQVSGIQTGIELFDNGYGTGEGLSIKWTSSTYTEGVELYVNTANRKLYFDDNVVIHSGNIANQSVASAGKLTEGRKLWGVSFDGSKDITGDINPGVANSYDCGYSGYPWLSVYTKYVDSGTANDLHFCASGGEHMRLTASKGCLILGGSDVAEPSNCKLWVNGNMIISSTSATSAKSNKLRFLRNTASDDYTDFGLYSQTTKGLTFFTSKSGTDKDVAYLDESGNFVTTGNITAGSASDRRLKDNIKSMTDDNALSVLKSLNPVTFEWNTTANELGKLNGVSDGFIADEYEKLIPNSSRTIWANYRAIDYTRVSGYLVKGWQNHETRLEAAERKIKELENELAQYRR